MLKKVLAVMLAISLLGIFSNASAASVSLGVESDFTINRDVEVKGQLDLSPIGTLDDEFDSSYEAQHYDVVIGITEDDTFALSHKIGFTKSNFNDEINSDSGFNFGTDAKVKLYKGKIDIDLLGKYRFSKTKYDMVGVSDYQVYIDDYEQFIVVPEYNTFKTDIKLHEYEIGPIVSKSFGKDTIVTPYIGAVYSDVKSDFSVGLESYEVEAKDNIGLRLGTSIKLANNINLFVDGALFDKQGVSAKVTYLF